MTASLAVLLLLMSQPPPATLYQVRTEGNPQHRARDAVEFAATAERQAEAAYDKGDTDGVRSDLKTMQDAVELARKSLEATGKNANRHPGPYKFAETRSHEILQRLDDFEHRMDESERPLIEGPKNKVQQIHDAWFDAIMGKKKK
jgi:hypothetical protein